MVVGDAPAQSTSPGNSTIISTAQFPMTFNAYVAAGENLDVTFTKVGDFNTVAQTINVSGPGGVTDTCTIPAGTTPDVCSFTDLMSPTSGIWEIEVVPITGTFPRLAWEIDAQNGTTSIPGRVFTTAFSLWQDWQNYTAGGSVNPDPTNLDQLDLWYVGEDGYQYETNYRIYNGNGSRFVSDGIGNRVAGTCLPAYRSLNTTGPNVDPAYDVFNGADTCGEPYKIFFETPAGDLPASAVRPDGSTDWLVPGLSTPDVSNLAFAPDGGATHSGTVSFDVSNFTGVATVLIDTDGDGTFNGPDDVSIPTFVTPGDHSVDFDGLDGSGNPVPSTRTINARVLIDRAGEIHFVNGDVERRSGGIEVTKLNGPEAGDATIYWDDRFLTNANRCSLTPNRDGRAGIDSGSSSAHNWGRCSEAESWGNYNDGINGAWGDARAIDDWTYHTIEVLEEIQIASTEIEITGGPCWRMLSSPVDGLTYADMLENLWTQGAAGSDYPGGTPNIFLWPNGQSGNDPSGWQALGDLNQVIPPGTGFLISVFADDDYDGVDDPFPKTLSVSGAAHTGDITPPMNTTDGGWTLVGNPYIEPVDFNSLTTTDLTGVGYVYDRDTGTWASTTTDGYGDVTDGAFVPGQGFFVQNTDPAGSPSLTFTEASRTTGGEFYGKQKELRDYLRLEAQGESLYNSMWIRFSENGSMEPAHGDALELDPLAEQYAIFGARKSDGTLVDIGHFPFPDDALEIPVHAEATRPGSYTLTATDLDLPAGTQLWFTDLNTDESLPLDASFEYRFTVDQAAKTTPDNMEGTGHLCTATPKRAKAAGQDRFMITTSPGGSTGELPEEVALRQNYPNPFNPSTVIRYELPVSSEVRLEVFDLLGRHVETLVDGTAEAGVHQVNFDGSKLSSGVYLYRLEAEGTIITKRLTLIK